MKTPYFLIEFKVVIEVKLYDLPETYLNTEYL